MHTLATESKGSFAETETALSLLPQSHARRASTLCRELQMCRELLEVEPACKWALLTTAWLLSAVHAAHSALASLLRHATAGSSDATQPVMRGEPPPRTLDAPDAEIALSMLRDSASSSDSTGGAMSELRTLFVRLCELDPMRNNHYLHLMDTSLRDLELNSRVCQ